MEARQVPIEEATKDDLLKFANENLGMEFDNKVALGKIRAGIRQVWRQDHIILYGERETPVVSVEKNTDPPGLKADVRALHGGTSKTDPKVRMFLNEAEGPGGQRAVFVSVNNVPMLIPRGEEVDVPYRYYLALKAAISTISEQDENTHDIASRDVPSFPFQVVRLPTDKEMEPWNLQEHLAQYPDGEAPPMKAVA
jgi:hypothetical protein|tara:strand:+ start:14038 stop:14625 length:588 start_codon:yes stop_codon:yes gene_type:complete